MVCLEKLHGVLRETVWLARINFNAFSHKLHGVLANNLWRA
jgi:hypothetical protein